MNTLMGRWAAIGDAAPASSSTDSATWVIAVKLGTYGSGKSV
jgi:hypothetical protein